MKYRAMKTFMGAGGVIHRRGSEIDVPDQSARQLLTRGLVSQFSEDAPVSLDAEQKPPKPHSAGGKKSRADDKENRK